MFTGIVQQVGRVVSSESGSLAINCGKLFDGAPPELGESISVGGCCLTIAEIGEAVRFDVSKETASRTTLGRLTKGDAVNLERALALGDRLGGHIVMGHVDGIGRLIDRDGERGTFQCPEGGERYLADKGSITIEGVSLTVVEPDGDRFRVAVVPHTMQATTLGQLRADGPVNVEYDVLARYVEKMLQAGSD